MIDFPDGAAVPNLHVTWIHGSDAPKYNTDPDIQVQASDEHTYILRQNMCVSWEAPFMFLLFGASNVMLLDTGATANEQSLSAATHRRCDHREVVGRASAS